MISIIGNESFRDDTTDSKSADIKAQQRRDDVNDLNNLGLLSFQEQSGLTPLDTLFGDPVDSKTAHKVRNLH